MIKAIPMEDWLRGCIYHDGRHGYVTLPTDKVHQIANYIQRTRRSGTDGLIDLEVVEADRKIEPTGYNLSPVEDEQQAETKTETQNSNLTFEKADEPQTCSVNGRPYTDCCNCECFKCTADEIRTERSSE